MPSFQLTTSRRGRPGAVRSSVWFCCLSTHDLTKRSTGKSRILDMKKQSFNSRPHEEVDEQSSRQALTADLSTHDLTKRSTENIEREGKRGQLSTHDLTKRSTMGAAGSWRLRQPFNSRPHEEVDSDGLLRWTGDRTFNSRPHEEVDNVVKATWNIFGTFNSRPHEEVDDGIKNFWKGVILSTHDLTKRSTGNPVC